MEIGIREKRSAGKNVFLVLRLPILDGLKFNGSYTHCYYHPLTSTVSIFPP